MSAECAKTCLLSSLKRWTDDVTIAHNVHVEVFFLPPHNMLFEVEDERPGFMGSQGEPGEQLAVQASTGRASGVQGWAVQASIQGCQASTRLQGRVGQGTQGPTPYP